MTRAFHTWLANDIGIDLGTANTLVYLRGKGIVINEPSVVAINRKTGQVVAVGGQAKEMLGRTPQHISAVRPLVEGVISDFEVTEEMLTYFINKAQHGTRSLLGPRVVVGVPSGITNVESRAVRDAARNAGARDVHIVEEPMAAAIGMRLPVHEAGGVMVIDIGGGTTDIAALALNGIVVSRNVRIAGDRFNSDIIAYVRDEFKIVIGEKTAEEAKHAIASVREDEAPKEALVRGRDLITGLPREVLITDADLREALSRSIDSLIQAIKDVLEEMPPEVLADVLQRGIFITGGGMLIRGFPELLSLMLKVPVHASEDPLTSVVRGTGIILEHFDAFKEVLMDQDELFTNNSK